MDGKGQASPGRRGSEEGGVFGAGMRVQTESGSRGPGLWPLHLQSWAGALVLSQPQTVLRLPPPLTSSRPPPASPCLGILRLKPPPALSWAPSSLGWGAWSPRGCVWGGSQAPAQPARLLLS